MHNSANNGYRTMNPTKYILDERKAYSHYTIQSRAIPSLDDGLKPVARRVIWMARDGKHYKSATLAGSAMPIHPHASPEGAVNTLAAEYSNNNPLLKGDGAFGTLLDPKSYGASRYTSVEVSDFCKRAFLVDVELIPMKPNYDGTLEEPVHFLPIVPMVLINPSEGIAVGFATNILPRSLEDVVMAQIQYLTTGKVKAGLLPKFVPTGSAARCVAGSTYVFDGVYTTKGRTIHITKLPYGTNHGNLTDCIGKACDAGLIASYIDNSSDTIDVSIIVDKDAGIDNVISMLPVSARHTENLNVIDFDHTTIVNLTPQQVVSKFTEWRLGWYVNRYERLRDLLLVDIQKYRDIQTAIHKKVNATVTKVTSKAALVELLSKLGIVYVDYIASLPVYRFSIEEYEKNERLIAQAEATLKEYERILSSTDERKAIYISELKQLLKLK